jgi:hypothetical protein
VTTIALIFATSYFHVASEGLGAVGYLAGALHYLFQTFGLFAVPAGVISAVVSYAERHFGATRRDVGLVFLVAIILYVVHLPLILLLWALTGLTRWPWH